MKNLSPISIVVLSLALGAGAGIIAASLTLSSLRDYSAIISSTGPIRLSAERPKTEPNSHEQALQEVREKVAPAVVEIFSTPSDATGAYEPGEGSGRGFFVTSDGWLLAAPYFYTSVEAAQAVVSFSEKIYPVQQVVTVPDSPIVFLKINISNAPVISFGDALKVQAGEEVFVVSSAKEIFSSFIFRSVWTGAISNQAEVINRRFELGWPLSSYFTGAPVVNPSGEVLGVVTSKEFGETSTVLPFSAIKPIIYSLLKDGKITSLWFGAVTTDLARAIGYDENYTRGYTQGALLGTISKNSPAETAGLQRGDIVLSVEGQGITDRASLDELLALYHPGETIALTIDRAGVISKINLTLGSY